MHKDRDMMHKDRLTDKVKEGQHNEGLIHNAKEGHSPSVPEVMLALAFFAGVCAGSTKVEHASRAPDTVEKGVPILMTVTYLFKFPATWYKWVGAESRNVPFLQLAGVTCSFILWGCTVGIALGLTFPEALPGSLFTALLVIGGLHKLKPYTRNPP